MPDVAVTVKPGSRSGDRVVEGLDGSLVVHVRARAVDGAANAALVDALARHWDVPRSTVTIVRGRTSRRKVVRRP